jgi:hypothetical protein
VDLPPLLSTSLELETQPREVLEEALQPLSELDGGAVNLELRKWRATLLEQRLQELPPDSGGQCG